MPSRQPSSNGLPGLPGSPVVSGLTEDMRFHGDEVDAEERITEVYLIAVRHPDVDRARFLASGISQADLDLAIPELISRGLIRPGGQPGTWEAIPPDVALPAMAARLDRRAASARALSSELTLIYQQARSAPSDGGDGMHLLQTLQELHNATNALTATAQREIVAVRDNSPRTAYLFTLDVSLHRERTMAPDGRPVKLRTVYDSGVLRFPRAGEVLLARSEGGEEFRFINSAPFSLTVADDNAAVLDLTSYDSSGRGSLYIRDRQLVLALKSLAESYWRLSAPMAVDGMAELDRRSVLILSLMAAGATDATIAAQSGISQRTVERKVRTMMNQLGASTRFQAGVQAARRGWL